MVRPVGYGPGGFRKHRIDFFETGPSFIEQDDAVDTVRPSCHEGVASGQAAGVPGVPAAVAVISDTPAAGIVVVSGLILLAGNRCREREHRFDGRRRKDGAVTRLVE